VTGYNFLLAEVGTKRLELLHGLVPKAVRFAMLVNPENVPIAARTLREVPAAARTIGLQIQILNASTKDEIEAAFVTLVRDRIDALFVAPDPFFTASATNSPCSRRAIGFQRPIPLATMSKLVG
jgi:putative ABC transport system substrate-binding protein